MMTRSTGCRRYVRIDQLLLLILSFDCFTVGAFPDSSSASASTTSFADTISAPFVDRFHAIGASTGIISREMARKIASGLHTLSVSPVSGSEGLEWSMISSASWMNMTPPLSCSLKAITTRSTCSVTCCQSNVAFGSKGSDGSSTTILVIPRRDICETVRLIPRIVLSSTF